MLPLVSDIRETAGTRIELKGVTRLIGEGSQTSIYFVHFEREQIYVTY